MNQVFVSYSHRDKVFLDRLKVHLKPFERRGLVEHWSDSRIGPGDKWRTEIAEAIDRSVVAVLLISADFLASDFIADNELPPLLARAAEKGVRILPVILKPCAFEELGEISQYQSINDPKLTLSELSESASENLWYEVASVVREAIKNIELQDRFRKGSRVLYDGSNNEFGDELFELYMKELKNPKIINNFKVYLYHFIDDLKYMPIANEMFGKVEGFEEALDYIKERFSNAGWEGDGTIRLMWIPPFVGAGVEDSYGVGVWFVKQKNNGTSFLASPVSLPFSRLVEQNN